MSEAIFFSPDILNNPTLSEQESQHCAKVLRMRDGDKIIVTDGMGFYYTCTLINSHPKHCIVSIDNKQQIPKTWDFKLHIAYSPTKNMDRNEWFIEKATEIGVDTLSLLKCRYSERKELKKERLNKIAISAMKQSKQAILPEIEEMMSFKDFIKRPFNGIKYIAHCYEELKRTIPQTYKRGDNALILIGPEGDFSKDEVENAIENNFIPVSLGDNRLRTETAALYACQTFHILNM